MTKLEAAKKILEQGYCDSVNCEDCPAWINKGGCLAVREGGIQVCIKRHSGLDENGIKFFTDYIKEHDMTDKDKALERLAAIEKEAAELRKIIEKPELVYDENKLYVGVKDGTPYIMAGYEHMKYFRFQRFDGFSKTEQGPAFPRETGQKCLDYHIERGFDIRAFDDTEEALEYFLSVLRSNK